MIALYSLTTASFVWTRNLSLKWRRDGTTSCNLEGALYCVVQDRTFDSQHETSLRHLFLSGRSYEAGPQH